MKLAIDLQDHEGISHDKIVWTLDDKATVDQLMDKIESVFKIDKDRQRLFFKGSQLLFGTLQKAGIENEDTVVLKHFLVSHWPAYLSSIQKFRETMDKTAKKEEASIAHEKSGILKEAGLFNVYPIFALEWDRLRGEYATYVGNTPLLIKEATKAFFIHKFSDKIVDVDFKNKPSVIEHGLLNMIELFIYKLLEIIGVGANVEIIPNLVTSDRIVYICGEEIPGFKTIAILEENWATFERKNVKHREELAKSLIQLSVLSQILSLGDLNSENVGFDENTAAPYIVDFQTSFIDSSVIFEDINHPKTVMSPVYKLKMNLGQFLELVKDKTFDEQLGIAKESIVRWDIDSKLDEAMAKLEEQKIIFNRTDLLFEKGTETVKEYIDLIREKVNRIINP